MALPSPLTSRLRLRAMLLRDVPWLEKLLIDVEIRQRTLRPAVVPGDSWLSALSQAMTSYELVIEEVISRTPVGWIMIGALEPAPHRVVGFEIRREFWNRGYATEAVEILIEDMFLNSEESVFSGIVFADNRASQRVFEKSGFQNKGECICQGKASILYELTSEEWRSRRLA